MQQFPLESPAPAPLPETIRTSIMIAGIGHFQVDEEVRDVVRAVEAFLAGPQATLWLTANRRPIAFSRKMIEAWAVAWQVNNGQIQVIDNPQVARALAHHPDRR